jgi:hypothetical protein
MRRNALRFNRLPTDHRRLFATLTPRRPSTASAQRLDHSLCIQPATRNMVPSSVSTAEAFIVMAALAMVCRAAAWCAVLACATADAAETEPVRVAAGKPVCLNAAETREQVKSRHLIEPFAALKFAAAQRKAEALSAKLCHTGDDFIYEITLLHRDGRLVHVEMEAATGKVRPTRETRESHETRDPQVK